MFAQIASQREWVMEVEPILDGSWANHPEEMSNAEVGRRLDDQSQSDESGRFPDCRRA